MKQYPSIDKKIRNDLYIYAFAKYDGSNIRAEWNNKKGFYKFGSRTELIDENSKPFGKAIALIKSKYENDLATVFKEKGYKQVICFFELFGPSSFAGQHNFTEDLDVVLIEVNPHRKGFLPPAEFIKQFGHLDIAKCLYEGHVDVKFVDQVKQSTLPNMPLEGVVCKGMDENELVMFKIKSTAWIGKLKEYCHGNEALFNRLI